MKLQFGLARFSVSFRVALAIAALTSALHIPAGRVDAAGAVPVRVGYFMVPPTDGTPVGTVASVAGVVVLSQNAAYQAQLRQAGYRGRILQYLLGSEVEGPGPYADAAAPCDWGHDGLGNQVADDPGDFCRHVHAHEDWFLHNRAGRRLYDVWNGRVTYHMDPASPGWRAFVLARLTRDLVGDPTQAKLGYDGLFLDNVELSLYKELHQLANSDGAVREYPDAAAYQAAWAGFLQALAPLRAAGPLWGNFIADPKTGSAWDPFLPHLDGALSESFATGWAGGGGTNYQNPTQWKNDLAQAEKALAAGKELFAVSQGTQRDAGRQAFALGSYLLVADGERAYFRYANADAYSSFWRYPNYDLALGAPRGPRYQRPDGSWRRDFACGSVTVDPLAHTASFSSTTCGTTTTSTATATMAATATPTATATSTLTATRTPSPTATRALAVGASTTTVRPAADTYVSAGVPTTGYGGATWLSVNGGTTPRQAYLRFSVPALPGRVTSARLRLFCLDPSDAGGTVARVASTTWPEGTTTWASRPAVGTAVASLGAVRKSAWYEVDVTAAVTGAGAYSFALTSASGDVVQYAAREDSPYAPQLVITTAP